MINKILVTIGNIEYEMVRFFPLKCFYFKNGVENQKNGHPNATTRQNLPQLQSLVIFRLEQDTRYQDT